MPRKMRRSKIRRGKRRGRRHRRSGRGLFNVIPRGGIFPNRFRTTLCSSFDTTVTLTATPGNNNQGYMATRGNAMYQSGFSTQAVAGTGAMSAYTASFAAGLEYLIGNINVAVGSNAPYFRSTVLACKTVFKFIPGYTNITPVEIVICPIAAEMSGTNVSLTQNQLRENPFSRTKMIVPNLTSASLPTITMSMTTKKIYAFIGNVLLEPSFSGTYNSNPSFAWDYLLSFINLQGNPAVQSIINMQVRQYYDVVFYERNFFKDIAPT